MHQRRKKEGEGVGGWCYTEAEERTGNVRIEMEKSSSSRQVFFFCFGNRLVGHRAISKARHGHCAKEERIQRGLSARYCFIVELPHNWRQNIYVQNFKLGIENNQLSALNMDQ